MKKIKTWQFNPPADEEDEWPIEPRFNPLLHPTMISDNHDNETRRKLSLKKKNKSLELVPSPLAAIERSLSTFAFGRSLQFRTWRKLAEIY